MGSIQIRVLSIFVGFVMAIAVQGHGQTTWRISNDPSGLEGNSFSGGTSVSGDGRFVAFHSFASNLVVGDTNGSTDVFVHDRHTGTTIRVSVSTAGVEGDSASSTPCISQDGRFVAFSSFATNLVASDTNGKVDIFVRDLESGTTERVSLKSDGSQANDDSLLPSISADGSLVAFQSLATDLVAGDTNGVQDIFVHERATGTTTRVSVSSAGAQGVDESAEASLSGDGRFVSFQSEADNLVAADTNASPDIFVHDRQTSTTTRASVSSSGVEGNNPSLSPAISHDGRYVAFRSLAWNLIPNDVPLNVDVYVHDRTAATTSKVSVGLAGRADSSSHDCAISADGRFVAFESFASNLVPDDTNGTRDVFLHDRQTGTTTRASVDSSGAEPNDFSLDASISADGRFVAFTSEATNLVLPTTNGWDDVYLNGPDLTLAADPEFPVAGDTLALSTWTGLPSGGALLAVVDVNGQSIFQTVALGTFNAHGLWVVSGTVPPGLAGNVVEFLSLGFIPSGPIDLTNTESVAFQ